MIKTLNPKLKTNNDTIHFLKLKSKRLIYLSNKINYGSNDEDLLRYLHIQYVQTLNVRDRIIKKHDLEWPDLL